MNESENKGFFKSLMERNSDNHVNKDDTDDYTVKKNKTVDIIIRILSVLGAIFIWVYVVTTNVASYEFKDIRVALRGEDAVERAGYSVEYDPVYITFKVQGGAGKISNLTPDSFKAYVDVSKIDLAGIVDKKTVSVPIKLEFPKGLTCVERSPDIDVVYLTISEVSKSTE